MSKTLCDEIVATDYGMFDIVWSTEGGFDGIYERFFAGQVNGLVGARDPHGIFLMLARRSGGSQVRIVLHESRPGEPDESWEDVVEVSTEVPSDGEPMWLSWASESGDDLDLPAGNYRVRVSARGRDAGAEDEFAPEVVDFYLVEFWPEAFADDAILRIGSENARYWHAELGSRR